MKDNYFVITGAMGAGKSTILEELRLLGLYCIDEPARKILAEQRAVEGTGVPETDSKLFTELLLSRSIDQYARMVDHQGPVIFDRGIPDNICYAKLFGLDLGPYTSAAHEFRYHQQVFFLPAWEAIYQNDEERKMTFAQAAEFGEDVRQIYEDLGYQVVEVPRTSPQERAVFISRFV